MGPYSGATGFGGVWSGSAGSSSSSSLDEYYASSDLNPRDQFYASLAAKGMNFGGSFAQYAPPISPRPGLIVRLLAAAGTTISAPAAALAAGIVVATTTTLGNGEMPQYVIRGGIPSPENLIRSAGPVASPYELLTGISVTTAPGLTVAQLAAAANYPNRQIGYTTVQALAAIRVGVAATPFERMPLHGTMVVSIPLDPSLAARISAVFTQILNPAR